MSYILYSPVLFVAPDTISCWYQVIGGYNMSHDQPLQYSAVVLSGGECCQWVQRNMNGWVSKEAKFTWHVQFPGDTGRKLKGRTNRIPRWLHFSACTEPVLKSTSSIPFCSGSTLLQIPHLQIQLRSNTWLRSSLFQSMDFFSSAWAS